MASTQAAWNCAKCQHQLSIKAYANYTTERNDLAIWQTFHSAGFYQIPKLEWERQARQL